jgi:hypothetical protein
MTSNHVADFLNGDFFQAAYISVAGIEPRCEPARFT